MARRKEFKTIADGLISSFVSRNNDVYGYWGIGKLYAHMLSSKSMTLRIDLINGTIEPQNNEFEILINEFSKRLLMQIKNRGINENYLISAELIIKGYPNEPSPYFGKMAPNRMFCKLVIKDDLNKAHFSEANTWCREHNPTTELKSTRKYLNKRKHNKS
jgi:hypothetical protein